MICSYMNPLKHTIVSEKQKEKANCQVFAYLTKAELALFLKAKSIIRENMVNSGFILSNENISETKVVKALLLFFCKENKIA